MRPITILILIAITTLVTVGMVSLGYSLFYVEDMQIINASGNAIEGKIAGFNIALDSLTFGNMPPGSASHRGFHVSHKRAYPLRAKIYAQGNISQFLRLNPTDFVIMPGERIRVEAILNFPDSTPFGNYTGSVVVRLTKNI